MTTIDKLEKAAKQALEALEDARDNHGIAYINEIVDLRQALEQPDGRWGVHKQQALNRALQKPAQQKPLDHKAAARLALRDSQHRSYEVARNARPQAREPLTYEQKKEMFINRWGEDSWRVVGAFYKTGIEDAEAAHGIHAPTERGEKK